MILKLTNNKNTYSFEVEDLNNGEKLFYHFQIPTSDMEDGNYKMVLLDGDEIITEEQVCIGAYNPQAIQYSRGENVYINAPFEANLEDVKEVEITAIETTVLPSEGYDGIKAVDVNAQPIFDDGYNVGNADGIEVGKAEQKALLEPITITENGTYENENGYSTIEVNVPDVNGSYDEGYTDGYAEGEAKGVENAGEIVAANAIVLDATEFRTYYTKYSDNIVNPNPITGVFPNGETFHNLANIINNIYNTNIYINNNSIIEFWYKGDGEETDDGWNQILNAESISDEKTFALAYTFSNKNKLRLSWGTRDYFIVWNDDVFNHLIISPNGVFLNDEKVVDIENMTFTSSVPCVINGIAFDFGRRFANGGFGMIKITTDGIENIIIPTEDGLKNITTDELLEVAYNEGTYEYINNDPIILDNLIKQVNVVPKIDIAKAGIKFAYSSFETIPEWADFSNVTNCSNMFYDCNLLINAPMLKTSIVSLGRMFFNGTKLENVPNYNTENVTDANSLFYNCVNLNNPPTYLNLLKCNNMEEMFYGMRLKDYSFLTNWDINPKADMGRMITEYNYVEYIPAIPNVGNTSYYQSGILYSINDFNNLTYFGGYIGRKYNMTFTYSLPKCPNLTYESCISILNNLYDFTGNGETPERLMGQLKVHPNFLTTVGDEISIGVAKGWIISA